MTAIKRWLVVAMVLAGFCSVISTSFGGVNTNLPFYDDFESYTNGTPLIDGTNGWYASSTNVIVQTNVVYPTGSTNAAIIPFDCTLSNRFENITTTNVWIQFDFAPMRYDGETALQVNSNATVMLYVNSNGYFIVYDGTLTNWSDPITSTVLGSAVTSITNGDWVKVDICQNYSNHTWTFFAESLLMKENIGFISNAPCLTVFDLYNGSTTSYLDNVEIVATNEWWRPELNVNLTNLTRTIIEGRTATEQTFEVWSNRKYYTMNYSNTFSATNWLSLSPSTGVCAEVHVTNTLVYTTTNLAVSATPYTATIQIDGKDSYFDVTASNSPLFVQSSILVRQIPVLSLSVSSLSQDVSKGGNPTNQSFMIWNSSIQPKAPMSYSNTVSTNLLILTDGSGISTGQHNEVGVLFDDISDFEAGTYTGIITVVSRDSGEGYEPINQVIQTNQIVVTVHVYVPATPSTIYASDGTDTSKVIVNWASSPEAASYEVQRCLTFNVDYGSKLAEVSVTNYNDTSASPGVRYFYWIRPRNAFGSLGEWSTNDSGYCALSAPGGVFASDGTYTNKIHVTWSASDGAETYEVYRSCEGSLTTNVYHASGTEYEDTQVSAGIIYTYKVKSLNSLYTSALCSPDTGYVFASPSEISASDGEYPGKVVVQWSSVASATGYEIWRAERGVIGFAEKISDTISTNYTDTAVSDGSIYYYWVRSKNTTATSGFSSSDSGYAATGSADLSVWDLVVLPNTIGTTSHPSVVSFRLANKGPDSLAGSNTAVRMNFYASTNITLGNGNEIVIGQVNQDITLSAGSNMIVKVQDVSNLTMPAGTDKYYYIFMTVNHKYPSLLVDTNLTDNTAMRAGTIHVSEAGSLPYRAINDYDGDGVSDLALYYGGYWYIRSVDSRVIAYGIPWGAAGMVPVYGDYDGDKISDLAVYGNGLWYVRTVSGSVILWGTSLGGNGLSPVYGAFSGSGSADLSVYNDLTGLWYIVKPGAGVVLWGVEWGCMGFVPVPGDYDGDGTWDMAVYNQQTGAWYVRTVSGALLCWAEYWGGLGYEPVPGDYNGDGLCDMAVYHEDTGYWFIRTLAGNVLAWAQKWGETGYVPVFGDYNGDGISDMAVYHEVTGKWYIRSVDGTILLWDSLWGAQGYIPVGR